MLANTKRFLQSIGAKHLAHVIMCIFAGASLFNISDFVYTLHHNAALAWTVAIALAASLVVFSALLSEMKWRSTGFYITLTVVGGLTAISGFIQGGAYALAIGWPGWAMGFAMPVFGELGASLALSVYAREQQARSMAEAQQRLSDGVKHTIIDALGSVDRTKVEAQVNRAIGVIAKEFVDSAISDMLTELRSNRPVTVEIVQTPPATFNTPVNTEQGANLTPSVENRSIVNTEGGDFTSKMNDGKRKKAAERQAQLFEILRAEFDGVNSDDLNKSALADRLGVTRQTISSDLQALEASRQITVNGHVSVNL